MQISKAFGVHKSASMKSQYNNRIKASVMQPIPVFVPTKYALDVLKSVLPDNLLIFSIKLRKNSISYYLSLYY